MKRRKGNNSSVGMSSPPDAKWSKKRSTSTSPTSPQNGRKNGLSKNSGRELSAGISTANAIETPRVTQPTTAAHDNTSSIIRLMMIVSTPRRGEYVSRSKKRR